MADEKISQLQQAASLSDAMITVVVDQSLPAAQASERMTLAQLKAYIGRFVADPSANGMVVRTALGTATIRAITAGTGILVTNGDGIAANPSIAIDPAYIGASGTLSQVTALGSSLTGAVSVDAANGYYQWGTLTGNVTLTLLAPNTAGQGNEIRLRLTQDVTGGRVVTWPGSVAWTEGSLPSLPTTGGAVITVLLATIDGGTTWRATWLGGAIRPHDDSFHTGANKVAVGDAPAAGSAFTLRSTQKQIAIAAPSPAYFKDDATNGKADLILTSAGQCAKPGVAQYIATASGTTVGNPWGGSTPNVVHYSPLFIPPAGPGGRPQIDELGVIVSTLYTTGSVLLALYACDQYGWPGGLLYKSSAAAVAMQTTGYKAQALDRNASNSVAVALIDPGKYWAAVLSTNADNTGALQRTNGSVFGVPVVAAPTGVNFGGLTEASAVFPTTASTTPGQATNAPIVFAKIH